MFKLLTAVLLVALMAPFRPAAAQNPDITIHLAPATGNGCNLAQSPPPCYAIDTSGGLGNYYAYVLVTNGDALDGISGLQFGISYNNGTNAGVDIWSWHLCATLEFITPGPPSWPSSGSGTIIVWDEYSRCQRYEPGGPGSGVVAAAGYFYMTAYSPDAFSIIPRPIDQMAKVADCSSREIYLSSSDLGYARFSASGMEPGYNPCTGSVPSGSCGISGPVAIPAGTVDEVYTAVTDLASPTFTWSVFGSGAIVGSNTESSVHVTAGPPGDFHLSVSIDGPGGHSDCGMPIEVTTDFNCSIPCGPSTVPGFGLATYSAPPGYQYAWQVTNGSIIGAADAESVQVKAGYTGRMNVQVTLGLNGIQAVHAKQITIGPVPPDPPDSQKDAKICLHVPDNVSKNPCLDVLPDCNSVRTTGGLYPETHNVFVLVSNGYTNGLSTSGVSGLQFGIDYDGAAHAGVDIYSWTLCATIEFPMPGWPAAGTGTIIVWEPSTRCQHTEPGGPGTGVTATAGYFYMAAYTPDRLRIVPRQVDGAAKVANCNGAESILVDADHNPVPSPLGYAGFGLTGFNPCSAGVPVVPTTWSRIKTMMK